MPKWTPEQEAAYALDYGTSRSSLSPEGQAAYARITEERAEARRAAELQVKARLQQAPKENVAATVWFPSFGVAVRDGKVYRHGVARNGTLSIQQAVREQRRGVSMQLLGDLAGARAEVVAGKAGHRRSGGMRVNDAAVGALLLGPVGLLAGASRPGAGVAVVVFANGTTGQAILTDRQALTRAQTDAMRFNTLAASAGLPSSVESDLDRLKQEKGSVQAGVAVELERLAALHSSGALDDEEFRAAKARIIGA